MSSPSAWLEFASGERIFLRETCSLGRSPANRVVLPVERVSRRHAIVRRDADGGFSLMDLGSSNGTYVNGQRVQHAVPLHDGSVIEVGLQKIIFRTSSASSGGEARQSVEVKCWLVAAEVVMRGCHTPGEEAIDKTFESWSGRCLRVISRYRGDVTRAVNDGLLASWRAEPGDGGGAQVVDAVRAMRAIEQPNEESHVVVHFGSVQVRETERGKPGVNGNEVLFALQMQKLARTLALPLLISASAHEQFDESFAMRALTLSELRGYKGKHEFFVPATGEALAA